jgi:hypothetical protein
MHNSGDESYLVSLGLFDMCAYAVGVEFGERDAFDVRYESCGVQCFVVGPAVNVILAYDCFNDHEE